MRQQLVNYDSDSRLFGIEKIIIKTIFLVLASMSKENDIRTNSTWIKCIVKLPCGPWLALALFKNTDSLNENLME